MNKYKAKEIVEAVQVTPDNAKTVERFINANGGSAKMNATYRGRRGLEVHYIDFDNTDGERYRALLDDYVVRTRLGFMALSPDVFANNYEPV